MAARLLRVASAALGDTAGRWRLLARPRAGAGGLRGSRGPGLGGGAAATRTLSVSGQAQSSSEDKITVHFINRDGETLTTKGKVGDSLLDVVVENNLDIDGFGESRLGCQICLTKAMDNMTVRVPDAVSDARESIDVGMNSSKIE
ncbi:hypothetical protein FD754_014789 [Muntiacus muntjak]|uniref:2Fe-2S ferredoxin-type domain-containing protein n=1 Tax=Muntiacus muntjak TaxID=9888 RepID=A0A5N3VL69_MUNMU|nr:hypothetical protein FD754_014789 [Muntiacus muntjak]